MVAPLPNLTNAFPKNDRAMRWYREACERFKNTWSVQERNAQDRVITLVGRTNGFRIALTRALADENATAQDLRAFLRQTLDDDAEVNDDDE